MGKTYAKHKEHTQCVCVVFVKEGGHFERGNREAAALVKEAATTRWTSSLGGPLPTSASS